MKRKMEVNYIRSYTGLGAAVTQYNGHYWQADKSHTVQWRAVLSQRLYASAIYMQFLFAKKESLHGGQRQQASGKFNSSWGVLCDMLFSSTCLFGQVCCEALQNQTAPAALALTAFLKAYKGCRRAIMRTWGKQSKSVSVCVWERERLFEYVANYLCVKFTVRFCTWAEIAAYIWAAMCISSTYLSERRSFSGCNYLSLLFMEIAFPTPDSLSGAFSMSFHFRFSYSAIWVLLCPDDFLSFLFSLSSEAGLHAERR